MNRLFHIALPLLVLLLAGSSCKKEPDLKSLSFSAKLPSYSASPFKGAWAEGDAITVLGVKDGTVKSEVLHASDVAADGTATFLSKGTLDPESDFFYAYIQGTGIEGCDPSSGWTVSSRAVGPERSASVAKCGKGASSFTFRNLCSFLSFHIEDPDVDYVVFSGNEGELVNYDALISISDYSVSASESPSFNPETSVTVDVKGAGMYYISLVPGTVFKSGYTLTSYNSSGAVYSKIVFSDKASIGSGLLYEAGSLMPETVSFTASFEDTSTPEFKHTWTEGDAIEVRSGTEGEASVEVIKASEVSEDGLTASFISNGTLTSDANDYYAMIPGTGIDGYQGQNWSTGNLDGTTVEKPSVTLASSFDGSLSFKFKNKFSLLAFSFDEPSVSYVILEGNNSETINKNMLVSFSKQAVNGNSSPVFSSTKTIRKNVSGAGTYYIGLIPGLKLTSGFTLTAYNAKDEVVGKSKNLSGLTVEGGKVHQAAEFVITKPSVLTKEFDESKIVLSLGVVSDVHINNASTNTTKWHNALDQMKRKAAEKDADGIDGVLSVGDLIDVPNQSYLNTYKTTYEGVFSPAKVPMIYAIGNHDVPNYKWSSSMVSDAAYIRTGLGSSYFTFDTDKAMGSQYECRDCQVGNYHILSVSPNSIAPILYSSEALSWLESRLKSITADNPNQYVVVITHPMVYNTVYGSLLGGPGASGVWYSSSPLYWETSALTSILEKYPQAVIFGGHLHFPLNDPRSVWQGDFTAFGCASVRYMAIENGGYENMSGQTVMDDANEFSQGNLVQFDQSGNMRLYRMDFYHNGVIGEPIVTSYPSEDKSHLSKYSFTARSLVNGAPVLSSLSVSTADGKTLATFAAGKDDEFVHHYVLTLKKAGATVSSKKILSDFYKSAQTSGMRSEWTWSLGTLSSGTYEVSLAAYDSWDAESNILKETFTIGPSDNKLWTGDAAGSKAYSGGDGSVSDGWLSYASGKVSWTANSTGLPRIGSINLPDGTVFNVTQISEEDFKGGWTMRSSQFGGRGNYFSRNDSAESSLTFGEPYSSENLLYGDRTITNNLGVRGLAANLVMDANVEIDYSGGSVRLGLFFDGRKAQKITSGSLSGTYGAFLPELASVWGTYEFGRADIGSPDYEWLWLTVTVSDGVLTAKYLPLSQKIAAAHNYSRDAIIGIEVMNFKGEDASDGNLVRQSKDAQNTENGTFPADWITIYQANYGTNRDNGLTLAKK